jgi:hypothetical protein
VKEKRSVGAWILVILIAIVVAGAVVSAISVLFMLLWNWIVPALFNGPEITFWMSWGIMFLIGLLGRIFFGRKKS